MCAKLIIFNFITKHIKIFHEKDTDVYHQNWLIWIKIKGNVIHFYDLSGNNFLLFSFVW